MTETTSPLTIDELLSQTQSSLKMGLAYYSQFTEQAQVVQAAAGEAEAFGLPAGTAIPVDDSYCKRMILGVEPGVLADATVNETIRALGLDDRIGCYVGVPLRLSDGRVYGSLCCIAAEPRPDLGQAEEQELARVAAQLVALLETHVVSDAAPRLSDGVKLSLWFSGLPQSPSAARNAISVLKPHLSAEQHDDLTLLVSELVTNAVRHAGMDGEQTIGLEIELEGHTLRGVVSDPGEGFARPDQTAPRADQTGGFGLVILDSMAADWGVRKDRLFSVWFEIDVS